MTATLSVVASQVNFTLVLVTLATLKPVGVAGAILSGKVVTDTAVVLAEKLPELSFARTL